MIKANITAPLIPPDVVVRRLVNIPRTPLVLYPSRHAWYKRLPNDVMGMLDAVPAKAINF